MWNKRLSPRQSEYVRGFTSTDSVTFGNAYRSALAAGYSNQTARNITHLQPAWLSESIGRLGYIIQPDEIMQRLTTVIDSKDEPTIIKLKALELTMKAYSMLVQRTEKTPAIVQINVDLTTG